MTDKVLSAIIAVCILVMLAGSYLLGLKTGLDTGDIKIAKLEKSLAQDAAASIQVALDKQITAQRRGDQLQRQLDLAEQTRLSQALEHSREIKRLTRGQPCLNAGAVRLLNRSGGIQQPAVPEAAGRTDAEDAPAATDTDVAEWIDDAARQYATCRDRLGALIDFETAEEEEK